VSRKYRSVIELFLGFNPSQSILKGFVMNIAEISILVADDDEAMRAMLSDYISAMGLKVKTAADVPDAERILGLESPPFDIVLADLKLPGGSGFDILKAAHLRSRDTLISIITGYGSLETAIEAIRLGAYDYITKPFSLDEIGIKIRNMAERVSLLKENSRLSLRLQELLDQVHTLQNERLEGLRTQEETRHGVHEMNRKLDLLFSATLRGMEGGSEISSLSGGDSRISSSKDPEKKRR
jgi:DNA-binding response OmpR family regulator